MPLMVLFAAPPIKTTTSTIRLTFRRRRCRIIVRVDRRVAD
jgi:hypothetical protein